MSRKKQLITITAVEPVKMNVLYVGVDNPVKIASSGYDASELKASIDNGTITGENGEFVLRPERAGTAVLTVNCEGKNIQESTFRVKYIPDPVAAIKCPNTFKTHGRITRKELLDAGGINVFLPNFDFDLKFEVVSFLLSTADPDTKLVIEESSDSWAFNEKQVDLINSLTANQKFYIEAVQIIGPDGKKRYIGTMAFTLDD